MAMSWNTCEETGRRRHKLLAWKSTIMHEIQKLIYAFKIIGHTVHLLDYKQYATV